MELVFLVVQIVIAVLLIAMILLQRTDSDGLSGLSGGSGNMGGVMSHKSANQFLVRTTSVLVVLFVINSLVLANISHRQSTPTSILEQVETSDPVIPTPPHSHSHSHSTQDPHKGPHEPAMPEAEPAAPIAPTATDVAK